MEALFETSLVSIFPLSLDESSKIIFLFRKNGDSTGDMLTV